MTYRQAAVDEPLLKDLGPIRDSRESPALPKQIWRERLAIPEIPEHAVVRHFTRLSQMSFGVDSGFYPLGSCTMKYSPKFAEAAASSEDARRAHPYQDEATVQGSLQILYELQGILATIAGVAAVSLQPAAGAQGEFTGLLIARACHEDLGEDRTEVILPDTAHGTNFASAAMAGYDVVEIPSKEGVVDLGALEEAAGPRTAAFMLTNPNTLGVFESSVLDVARIVHEAGALLYYDGANMNAILGKTNPGAMGFDIVHFNLHKTFGTPHGGGGPGAGPVGVVAHLEDYLPVPVVVREGERYRLEYDRPKSVGKVRSFYGNFGVLLRAYAYILRHGSDGLERNAERAVLNANYLRRRLAEHLHVPYGPLVKHEFVASAASMKESGLSASDLAKRLMDHGMHPPTVYFPHLVDEALMVEPTETETKGTLDAFADAVGAILLEDVDVVKSAPHNASVRRVDEAGAARRPVLSWRQMG